MSSLIKGFISILGGKVSTLLSTLTVTPLFIRFAGSREYGDLSFALSVFSMLLIFTSPGLFGAIRKFVAEDRAESNWEQRVFMFYLGVGSILAVIVAIVISLFTLFGYPELYFGRSVANLFYLIAILLLVEQSVFILRGVHMGLGDEFHSELLLFIRSVVFALLSVLLAYLGFGAEGFLFGRIMGSVVASVVGVIYLGPKMDFDRQYLSFSDDFPAKRLLSFNLYSGLFIAMTASLYNIDIIFVQYFLDSEQTAYYRASLLVAEFLWFVPNALQTLLLHSTSKLWSKDKVEEITQIASDITRYNLFITLLFLVGIAVLAEPFVSLYFGDTFDSTVIALIILLPGAFGFAIARPIFSIVQGKGEMRIIILGTAIPVAVNAVLNAILIPMIGINGAAGSTSVGYGLMIVIHGYIAKKVGFNPFVDIRLLEISLTGLVTFIVLYLLNGIIESPVLSLLIIPPSGFAVYVILGFRLGVFEDSEVSLIKNKCFKAGALIQTKLD